MCLPRLVLVYTSLAKYIVLQPRACLMLGHATHTHDMLPNELPLLPAASLRRCRAALAPSVHSSCCKSSRSFTKAAASFFSFPPPPTRSYFGPSSFPKRETTILAQLCGHRDSCLAPFPMPPIFIGRSFSFAASEDLRYWGHSWIRILALSGMSYESKKNAQL